MSNQQVKLKRVETYTEATTLTDGWRLHSVIDRAGMVFFVLVREVHG